MRFRLLALLLLALSLPAVARASEVPASGGEATSDAGPTLMTDHTHRVIVRLASPALARYAASGAVERAAIYDDEGLLDLESPAAQAHLARLEREQESFLAQLDKILPEARVDYYIDELGMQQPLRWSVVFNGMTLTAGLDADAEALAARVRQVPGVQSAEVEALRELHMFDSLEVVNAFAAWESEAVGGSENAGLGIRFASVDCGAHVDAPMFDGTDYDYPAGYPLGDVRNTNGKIIASRAYFRSYDPPPAAEAGPWPGPGSSSHGLHTIGTAAGNRMSIQPMGDTNLDPEEVAGVAPAAYIMSYRICYAGTFVAAGSIGDAEAIAAHEDLVADKAHVVNNSWGGGPWSIGGVADGSEVALENAWHAGVFVSVSNGNSGPNAATMDHPSPLYINVANSTKGSTFALAGMRVTAPEGMPAMLQNIPFTLDQFGEEWSELVYGPYIYKTSVSVDPDNFEGCNPWPEDTFDGMAAVISRGACSFNQKVLNAENAGAVFAVIHNHAEGGETLTNMITEDAEVATIHAVFTTHNYGNALNDWYDQHPGEAAFLVDRGYEKLTSESDPGAVPAPDVINPGSSRGPAAGNLLKPDIAAPGTAILSQGFGPAGGAMGHMQFGQASGTSMASPHVAGAAAVLRAAYPDWTIEQIKAALMATAQYMDIDLSDGSPAQPLDMGAGRLDVAAALDPGALADPPSLSFGQVVEGDTGRIEVTLTGVAPTEEIFTLGTVDTRPGYDAVTELAGVSITPEQVTLGPGDTVTVVVEWDASAAGGTGDQQGYVTAESDNYAIHMPAWMRVAPPPTGKAALLIDYDGSIEDDEINVVDWYTETLESAFVDYDIWDVNAKILSGEAPLPRPEHLSGYDWVLFQSGGNGTPLPSANVQQLNEYMNTGGRLAVFGENAHAALADTVNGFWDITLSGSAAMNHSITGDAVITDTLLPVFGPPGSPFADLGLRFDLSATGDGAGNQDQIHEIDFDDDITPLLMHSLVSRSYDGYVAGARMEQPSLEVPGVTYPGRSMVFGFGLEGISNQDIPGYNTRQDLMFAVDAWLNDEVSVSASVDPAPANTVTYFTATVASSNASPVQARIDYGDGSPYGTFQVANFQTPTHNVLGYHIYRQPGTYTVRVEGTDSFGVVAFTELEVDIEIGEDYVPGLPQGGRLALPWMAQNAVLGGDEGP